MSELALVTKYSDEKHRLLARLDAMYQEGLAYRKENSDSWKRGEEFYKGQQWGARPEWKSTPVRNYVGSKTRTVQALLTDNRIRIQVLPRESAFKDYADTMNKFVDYTWDVIGMDEVIDQGILTSLLFSKAFYYSYFDHGERRIVTELVDPRNIVVNKGATCIQDARFLCHTAMMSRSAILARWPAAAEYLKVRSSTQNDPFTPNIDSSSEAVNVGTRLDDAGDATNASTPYYRADSVGHGQNDLMRVRQFWIRDEEMVQEPLLREDGTPYVYSDGSPVYIQKYATYGGRHVIEAGNCILHDGPNPFLHQEFPYVEHDCYPVPGEFWGISFVADLIDVQKELNKTLSQIIDAKNFTMNPMVKYKRNGHLRPEMMVARPGNTLPVNDMGDVEFLNPPQLPSYVLDLVTHSEMSMDRITGVNDVMEGRKPSGIQAGVAIEQLQEAGNTKIRQLARRMERAVSRLGRQWLALSRQYIKEGQEIRIVNPETGEFTFLQVTPEMIRGEWDVFTVPGSSLPKSREARFRQALSAMEAGLFDQEAALDWLDHPSKDAVLARIRQLRMMQMQVLEESRSASGGGMEGPPPTLRKPQVAGRGGGFYNQEGA